MSTIWFGRSGRAPRPVQAAFLILFLALIACNMPSCGQQPVGPTPPYIEIPATTDLSQLPPTQPQIVAQRPYPGEEIPLDGSIDIYFDQPMNRGSVESALKVDPSLDLQVVWVDDATVRVTPEAGQLERAKVYTMLVSETAESARGLKMESAYESQIQTVGFLAVGDVVPAPDSSAAETDSVITVFFNRPVVPLVIAEDTPNLPNPLTFAPDVPGQGEWLNTSIYQWTPDQPLAGGSTYTVTVDGSLVDQTGGVMTAPFTWSFTTLPPSVIEVLPADGQMNVGLNDPIVVTFNQPMDRASTQAAFSLRNTASDQNVSGSFEWDEDDKVMTFKPQGGLALDGVYLAQIETSAQSATGGALLNQRAMWQFMSVATPAVTSTSPIDGEENVHVYNGIHIYFSAPMDQETVSEDMISVSPALPAETTYYYSDYDNSFNVNAELEPSTTYNVTWQGGSCDPYGNCITSPTQFNFTTAPLEPLVQLNVQGQFGIYDANQMTELFVLYRNVSSLNFRLASLSVDEFAQMTGPNGYDQTYNFSPNSNNLVREWNVASEGALNEQTYVRVPLTNDAGDKLTNGIYMLIADAPEVEGDIRHFVIVTNANLTFKTSFDEGLVWLTDLRTGQPISGAAVTIHDENMREIGTGTTDSTGAAEIALPHSNELYRLRYAIVQSGGTFALAMNQWGDGINGWDFGLPMGYDFQDFSLYMYTDRPLYRPGQDVFFKGVFRTKNDVEYSLPADANITVRVYNSDGVIVAEQSLPFSELGTFNGAFSLDTNAGLGYYTVEAEYRSRTVGLGFQVAEYRKPEFQVGVTPEADEVAAGETISVSVNTEFYFGGPVSDAEVTWTALAGEYVFQYTGQGIYSFGDYDREFSMPDDYIPGFGTVIADGSGTTDAQGNYTITLPASLEDNGNSRRLTIEATVTDINGQSVSNRAEVIVHKSQYYVGVRPDEYVAVAEDETSASLIVVDWNSQPIKNQNVEVQIVERRWSSVQEEDEFGRTEWVWNVEEIPVGTPQTVKTNNEGRATAKFTVPRGGIFQIVATVTDPQGREQSGSGMLWVSGAEYVAWRQDNNNRIDLVTDQTTYKPGDTAEILIASPFQGQVQALITIERGSIISHEVITLPNNSYVYELPITGELAPNVFVSVVIVKGVDDSNPVPAFRVGMVGINIDPVEQTLNIEVTPDRETAGPREQVTYTVEATDADGRPMDAEVSLALVDLAALALSGPNSGPILQHFYGTQVLAVNTSVPLVYLVNSRNQELFDKGKGGGGGGAEGFFDVRGDFRDTAYWTADVRTGDDGSADVTVTLPDNLTTWRMDARGVTGSTLVGQAQSDIVTTKPLLIRPVTPRFFVAGDVVTVSAVVNNNSDSDVNANVTLDAEGVDIASDETQVVSVPARGRVEVSWAVTVTTESNWVDMTFSVKGGRLEDASKPPLGDPDNERMLPVYRYEVPETVGTAGQLTGATTEVEGVVLPPTYDVTEGYVRVQIDPSLAASTLDGLTWLENYPYDCTEQLVSRFLPNALTLKALKDAGMQNPELEANLNREIGDALQRLYSQQHVDGGWGWFVTEESSPTVTAYVIQGLVAARDSGTAVEDRVINAGLDYLSGELRALDALDAAWKLDRQAYMLYVMALAGRPDASRTVQMYEVRQSLQHWGRALIAQTLWRIDPNDPRLADIQSDLVNSARLSATGAHWQESEDQAWNWNTDTRSTAIILDTFALIWPESDLGPNIVRWLMVAREGSHWQTTQETAWALIGLTKWMTATGELDANYEWNFRFNGAQVMEGEASEATLRTSSVVNISVADLVKDDVNRLIFERTDGAGRMYYTAHMTVYLPVEEVDPLSRGVVVNRRYLDADGNAVTQGHVGDALNVEVTIIAPSDLYYLVVEDPYPAGAEAIDTSLLTESILGQPPILSPTDPLTNGWGWWWFSQTEFRDEKVLLFAETLPAGTYQFTYQIRLGLPGTFRVIPPTAFEFYFPEVYGRGEGMLFTILP